MRNKTHIKLLAVACLVTVGVFAVLTCSEPKAGALPNNSKAEKGIWASEFTIIRDIDKLEDSIYAVMETENRLEQFCEKEKRYPNEKEIEQILSIDKSELMDEKGRLFLARVRKKLNGNIVIDVYTFGVDGKVGGTGQNEDIAYRSEGKPLRGFNCLSSIDKTLLQKIKGKNKDEREEIYRQILKEIAEQSRENRSRQL